LLNIDNIVVAGNEDGLERERVPEDEGMFFDDGDIADG
jgi:hypothetical protein